MTLSNLLFGQNGIHGCGSTHYSTHYEPTLIKQISDLPILIQDSVKKHILNKVGQAFFSLIHFENGLIIDYNELIKQDPKVLNYRWQVPKYDLSFYISQKQTGIDYYCQRLTMDSNGVVLDQIYFPDVNSNPHNATFDNLEQIKKIAHRHGFPTNNYYVNISENHFVLTFKKDLNKKYWKSIEISAHTGQIITQYKRAKRKFRNL